MNTRFLSPKGFVAPTLSLLALVGLTCWLPMRLLAQTNPPPAPPPMGTPPNGAASGGKQPTGMPEKDKNAKPDDKSSTKTDSNSDNKYTAAGPTNSAPNPPRVNPIILNGDRVSPLLVPGDKETPKERQDHRQSPLSNGPIHKDLPLFGYDFFKPQRDAIEAHRNYLRRLQEEQLRGNRPGGNGAAENPAPKTDSGTTGGTTGPITTPNGTSISPTDINSLSPSQLSALQAAGLIPRNGAAGTAGGAAGAGAGAGSAPGNLLTGIDTGTQIDAQSALNNTSRNNDQSITNNPQFNSIFAPASPIDLALQGISGTPPINYTLGPGDDIQIQYYSTGQETQTITRRIDANGGVVLPTAGPINLTGKTLEGAEKALTVQLRRFFNNPQVVVSLNRLRSIHVTISGAAYLPGTYAIPSVAHAIDLVYASGGPTEDGSLRAIEVRRQGRLIATIDWYKYQLGDHSDAADVPLQSGDMIYIPNRESRISIGGEVKKPAIFELLQGETLKDGLRFAGGIKPSGVAQRLQISSVNVGAERILRDVDLKKPGADQLPVFDGDFVEVKSVRAQITNFVSIEGAVDQPSQYELTPGMKVSDLLQRSRGLLNEAFPVAELHRWLPDNTDSMVRIDLDKAMKNDAANDILLTKWDRIKVYTRDEVAWTGHRVVNVSGAVKSYGTYTHSKNMRISDLLRMAGGPTPDAYMERAVLMHQHDDAPPSLEYINLNAIIRGDTNQDVLMQDNDNLAIYTVGQAQFTPDHIVRIEGEVVAPGSYPRAENMRISDLMILSGGFKPSSGNSVTITHARRIADMPNTPGSKVTTLSSMTVNFDSHGKCAPADDLHLEDGDVVTIQGVGGYMPDVQTIRVLGAVNKPGFIPLTSKKLRISDALQQAGGLRPEAFPQGAEFYRDPKVMETSSQRNLAVNYGQLIDLLNDSDYRRERAQKQFEVITETGQAAADAVGGLGGLAALSGTAAAAVPATNVANGIAVNQTAWELVTAARRMSADNIEPDGNIAINLPNALRKPQDADDIILQNGDTITIPETPTTVQIVGAVNHQRAVLYRPNETLQQYVDEAGGYTIDAAKDRIEVIRVGGGLMPGKKVHQLLPGDVIVIPNKVMAARISRNNNVIGDFFKNLTSSALIFRFASSIFGL